MTAGLGETVLPPVPDEVSSALAEAATLGSGDERREAISRLVAAHPTSLEAWAELGAAARDDVEAYACYRVGYHRGLDALRAAGWRGSGYVRWSRPSNRGFLKSLAGLADTAARIGETTEAERCGTFIAQLDPEWAEARSADAVTDT